MAPRKSRRMTDWSRADRVILRPRRRLRALPGEVTGVCERDGRIATVPVKVKDGAGDLLGSAIPSVTLCKSARYLTEGAATDGAA